MQSVTNTKFGSQEEPEKFYRNKIFISHRSCDSESVNKYIIEKLDKKLGIRESTITFTSSRGYFKGSQLLPIMMHDIMQSSIIVVYLTNNYFKSKYCLAELGYSFTRNNVIYIVGEKLKKSNLRLVQWRKLFDKESDIVIDYISEFIEKVYHDPELIIEYDLLKYGDLQSNRKQGGMKSKTQIFLAELNSLFRGFLKANHTPRLKKHNYITHNQSLYSLTYFSVKGHQLRGLHPKLKNPELINEAVVIWNGDQSASPMNAIGSICNRIGISESRIYFMIWPAHDDSVESLKMFTTAVAFYSQDEKEYNLYDSHIGKTGNKAWELLRLPAYRDFSESSYSYSKLF